MEISNGSQANKSLFDSYASPMSHNEGQEIDKDLIQQFNSFQ